MVEELSPEQKAALLKLRPVDIETLAKLADEIQTAGKVRRMALWMLGGVSFLLIVANALYDFFHHYLRGAT